MRLAIISDIHEDIEMLKEAFRKIEKQKCDEVVCLGDISGYSAPYYNYLESRSAHECLKLVKANCKIIVLGNHDFFAAKFVPKNSQIFDFPENWYQLDYQTRKALANDQVWLHEVNELHTLYPAKDLEFLRTLQQYDVQETVAGDILFSHYAFPNISGFKKSFYYYADEFRPHFQFMREKACQYSFIGHSHVKGFFKTDGNNYKQYKYKKIELGHKPTCIGVPPVTRLKKRSGFCIFDSNEMTLEAMKI